MSSHAAAQLLSVTLYYRRFFPYYAFCMIGGIDENGTGLQLAFSTFILCYLLKVRELCTDTMQ